MQTLISKIENAILVSCAFGLLVVTLWNFGSVFTKLSAYTDTQVYDTILLTALLLIFQLGIAGIIYAKKKA
jgi:hypothetical protein